MSPTSRQVAVETLVATERGEPVDTALTRHLRGLSLPPGARGRATALSYGCLRLRHRCDFVIKPFLKRPFAQLHPVVRAALRVGTYELLWAQRAEPPAVVHSLVELTRHHVSAAAGFVNAVLRRVADGAEQLREPPAELLAPKQRYRYLSDWESHPRWLVDRWVQRHGLATTEVWCRADNREPQVHLRVNPLRCTRDQLQAALAEAGVVATPGRLHAGCLRLTAPGDIEALPGFAAGWFTVQDEGAMLVAGVAEPQPDQRVIDLCAAPGGKAGQLAELMGNQGTIVACDLSAERLDLVRQNALRTGLDEIVTELGDGRELAERLAPADVVLVDAPCSGTGTLARRADLRWRLRETAITALARDQQELLAAAARLVRPGGCLVYATCSLEREENEDVMAWFDQNQPEFRPDGRVACAPPGWVEAAAMTTIRPDGEDHDGFYVARRRRHR